MKKIKVTKEEIEETKRRFHKELVEKDIENAKTMVIEKKGDFLRLGNNFINLKNIDLLSCEKGDGYHAYSRAIFPFEYSCYPKEAIDIIIERIWEIL